MSQCPLQQNKDFNVCDAMIGAASIGHNAPSNRTRISTRPPHVGGLRGRVAMPPPTEQGFQHSRVDTAGHHLCVAMPPPTEQGFQRQGRGPDQVAMPPPTEQGFQLIGFLILTQIGMSQCPLQQNKDFNDEKDDILPAIAEVAMPPPTEQGFQHRYRRGATAGGSCRNAPSNRTRISTSI